MRIFAALAWLAMSPQLCGWGREGHSLIARLAAARLNPKAAARVAAILGPGVTLASIASWADDVRPQRKETEPWHYVNIPIDKPRLDMNRDCPKHNCVLVKIEDFERVLADKNTPGPERKEALMFLVHFIGDMNQPLHCADNHDKGGNDVKLEFYGRQTNLHSLWDTGLLARMGREDDLFADLDRDLTPKRNRSLAKRKLFDWAEDAHRQSQLVVYGKLPKAQPLKLDGDYQQVAEPVVRLQLERAGARLAKVLNDLLK